MSSLVLISWIAVGYGALVTLAATYAAYRWRARPPWLGQLVWMFEFLTAVRAIGGLGVALAGNRPDEPATYYGYLAASVCILPLALRSVDDDDESPWAVGVIAVAALAVTVIGVRIMMTA